MEITPDSLRELIAGGESDRVEFKTTLQWDVKQNKHNPHLRHEVLKTIAAFLNSDGGTLLIGVEDDGSIYGLEKDLKLTRNSPDHFEQLIASQIRENLGVQYRDYIDTAFATIDGKTVYVVRVSPSPEPAYLKGKQGKREFYIRQQTTSPSLDPKQTQDYIQHHFHAQHTRAPSKQVRRVPTIFSTVAIPHDDILEGRLSMETFAADLWEVHQGRTVEDYRDPDLFFRKTYMTAGLKALLDTVRRRVEGRGGAPVIQLQTPFGGGKTHALIAIYHKAHEWNARTVVLSGTTFRGEEPLWGVMAEQLTGSREGFEGRIAPGRDAIRQLLDSHQPVVVLIDEILEYVIKAAAVPVGQSTMAAQTLAFMQELTEAAAILEKVVIVLTIASSSLEHYDESATRFHKQLGKISGRVEHVYAPVKDDEVGAVIQKRLFSSVREEDARAIVDEFVDRAVNEAVLPREESRAYRLRFLKTYPFLPEVIDVLYHRWGSYPEFQRTRGVLRLLAMVVNKLQGQPLPYITLADFDLSDASIRNELTKHLGQQYESVIASDITSEKAGARRVNRDLGKAYRNMHLGERVATTIFMTSFIGGGGEGRRGATLNEIKLQNLRDSVPSSIIAEVLEKLFSRYLYYLHKREGRYYFDTTPNLNQVLTNQMDNIDAETLRREERRLLTKHLSQRGLDTYLWPEESADIPDDQTPKLIILPEADEARIKTFIARKGQTPRVYRNTLFFLAPYEPQRAAFEHALRRHLAISAILRDETLSLTDEQRRTLKSNAKEVAEEVDAKLTGLYRRLYLPDRDGLQEMGLGIPTHGDLRALNEIVYERLRQEGRLLQRMAPLVIAKKYLGGRPYIGTRQLVESTARTPGEALVSSREAWKKSIADGVRLGLFGLGTVDEKGEPRCLYFRETPPVNLEEGEYLIQADLCEQERAPDAVTYDAPLADTSTSTVGEAMAAPAVAHQPPAPPPQAYGKSYQALTLRFTLPFGQVSSLLGLLNMLQMRFRRMEITVRLRDGEISEEEIENTVRETFNQIDTPVEIDEM